MTRSIESFLAGGDPSGDPASEDGSPPDTAARDAGAGDGRDDPSATTVAIVAVGFAGIGPKRRRGASTREAVALVERTLRATARRRDEVQAAGPGRFRIVLAATGELAARAYLRRIRTIVEPLLALERQPAVLHIAIATVLDEPLETAIAVAEQRLAAAIATAEADAAAQVGAMDAVSFPQDPRRAAGD